MIIAILFIATMFGLGLNSMMHNSAIVDEIAHIPASYSYLKFGDYRLNPEHPPLIKDMAGFPLLFQKINFPNEPGSAWDTSSNAQWDTGWKFLYYSGNNVAAILFWARLPILLLSTVFAAFLYLWAYKKYGIGVGLMCLFFYTFSPNIIANSIIVTTDLGASIFIFIALVCFVRFIKSPSKANVLLLGLTLALAQLSKFSSVMLYPTIFGLGVVFSHVLSHPVGFKKRLGEFIGGISLASLISLVLVWIAYIPETINMPSNVLQRLISYSLPISYGHVIGQGLSYLAPSVIFKPIVVYLLGVVMVFNRVAGGNTTYFMGQITNQSFKAYFPVLFILKTQIALLILMLVLTGVAIYRIRSKKPLQVWKRLKAYIKVNPLESVLLTFALSYFSLAVIGNLNLGLRHILPIYIPIFLLVSIGTIKLARRLHKTVTRFWFNWMFILLLFWYGAATIWISPSFLAYFNELIGGPANADAYFSDSSIDWGQDLIRLKDYAVANNIKTLALDYFGGADPKYYFQDGSSPTIIMWHSSNEHYTGQYLAVSETFVENDLINTTYTSSQGYAYLKNLKPIAKVGYSIYIYKLY